MTEEQYENLQLMLKGCGACTPMYSKLNRFEKAWFSRIVEILTEKDKQIEKLIDFVLSKTECCDVCPITDTCINSEGTCPYVGILAKGEEEVTREWILKSITKE